MVVYCGSCFPRSEITASRAMRLSCSHSWHSSSLKRSCQVFPALPVTKLLHGRKVLSFRRKDTNPLPAPDSYEKGLPGAIGTPFGHRRRHSPVDNRRKHEYKRGLPSPVRRSDCGDLGKTTRSVLGPNQVDLLSRPPDKRTPLHANLFDLRRVHPFEG